MTDKNWTLSGAVTVYACNGAVAKFDSIVDAVRYLKHNVADLNDKQLGYLWMTEYEKRDAAWREYLNSMQYALYCSMPTWTSRYTKFVVCDELGLRIPAWKIKEVYNNLPNFVEKNRRIYGYRRRNGRHYRSPKTMQEMRNSYRADMDEEELVEFGYEKDLSYRRKTLPTMWDDLYTHGCRSKNWKRYRRTQYK